MVSPSRTVNVMLAVQEKRTSPVDLYGPMKAYIERNYSAVLASDYEEDLRMVQKLREDVERSANSLEDRRDLLQRYYRALCVMESRFPISGEKTHVNAVAFAWSDAFKPGKKATQRNIHFEKASVVFNLGAVQSQIALGANRSTLDGIKQACNCFQAAAGAFAFLRDKISLKASNGNNSTVDVSVECAGMLERLMLAQAQECFFEKAISDNKAYVICSKLARQVGLYYEEAQAALTLDPLNKHIEKSWVTHVQLKAAQYYGEACYRVSLDLHEKQEIGEEIARLSSASSLLARAIKSGRGAVNQLFDTISSLEAKVNCNLEQAKKENDRVYLMRVPSAESLTPLPEVSLVKPSTLLDVLDASNEKMFASIVPDSSTMAFSRYTEMLDEVIRSHGDKLQRADETANGRLKEMDLPESLHALDGGSILPQQLREDVEAVQLDGGPLGLENEMAQLKDLNRINEEMLIDCERILQKEAEEDARLLSQYGKHWTRPQSATLTKSFQDRINSYRSKLLQAGKVDERIRRIIHDNWDLMSILSVKPIVLALPTVARPIMSLDGDETGIIGALKQSLAKLENLATQRVGLQDMLKEMRQKDNILPKLMSTSGSYEELFKIELAKYDHIFEEVDKNVQLQEQLLEQIKVQNNSFVVAFKLQDFKASQERTFEQINKAIAKYREIRDNINNAGLNFYISLQAVIGELNQQCSDYVMTREIQSQDMIEDLQRQMSRHSPFGTSSPGQQPQSHPNSGGGQVPPPQSHNYSQPPYPGWQGAYYNADSLNAYSSASQASDPPQYPNPRDN